MKDITILSTACGSMFMPGFFKCLRNNGERKIRIVGVDAAPSFYMEMFIDKFYQVSSYRDPDYLNSILQICKKEKVDIVFPQISMELELFAANIDQFHDLGIKVAISNPDTLSVANDKLRLYDAISNLGLSCPKYMAFRTLDEFNNAIGYLGYPQNDVCIKISDGCGQRGVRIVSSNFSLSKAFIEQKPSDIHVNKQQMETIVSELEGRYTLMAMECLHMPEYTVDLLADYGHVVAIGGRLNTQSSMSIAQASETLEIPEAYKLCTEIVSALKLDGNIGFDFMFDSDNRPVLTDLNPRITATVVIFLSAGLNLPYLRVKQLLNEKIEPSVARQGIKLIRKYNDIIIA